MGSEILIVITGVIAIIVLAAAYYLIMPVFLEIQQNPTADCQASAECTAIFDRQYDVMFVLFELFIGGIFFAMYMRAVRRDSIETTGGYGEF